MDDKGRLGTNELVDLRVSEILRRWPASLQVFLAFRMACIGCAYSEFDTLEEAARAQDVQVRDFARLLRETLEGQMENS